MNREIYRGAGIYLSSGQLSTSSTKAVGSKEGGLCSNVIFARLAGDKLRGTEEK